MRLIKIILLFALCTMLKAQNTGQLVTITGDSLVGSNINGESVREIMGNVVLTQGNIRITCKHAFQYLARNDAILTGNVVVTQNNLVIKAPKGSYYGDEKIAECRSGVQLEDGKIILDAVNGNYYFNGQRAYFSKEVKLRDKVTTLTCNILDYYRNEEKAVAVDNVVIWDSVNTICADTVVHFRRLKNSIANGSVKLKNSKNNAVVYGGHLEDYSPRNYTLITENPLLVQADTSDSGEIDTLVIASVKMEVYNDSTRRLIATDSVKMVRGEFSSCNEFSEYFRDKGEIKTYKTSTQQIQPVLWYSDSQLTGDSISIKLRGNILEQIDSYHNAFVLSQNKIYSLRYDQMSGEKVRMYFDSSSVSRTEVNGGVLSIYYTYDKDSSNGLTKSSSENAVILFSDNQVSQVKLYISPVSEYYPENLVLGKERSFTLPSFVIRKGRPLKNELLKRLTGLIK